MTLTVHHLQVSQSERVPWLCEELGIPYKLVLHTRDHVFSPPELKALTPLGTAPVIEDKSSPHSESDPLILSESAAVVEYIAQRYGGGRFMLPPSHKDYAAYLYWWHASNGTLQPAVSGLMTASRLAGKENPGVARLYKRLDDLVKIMDSQLAKGPWLAGEEFTIADIMTVFTLTSMRKFVPFSMAGHENLLAWLQRCAARPAYQKAREKCDPEWAPAIEAEAPPLFGPLLKMAQQAAAQRQQQESKA